MLALLVMVAAGPRYAVELVRDLAADPALSATVVAYNRWSVDETGAGPVLPSTRPS